MNEHIEHENNHQYSSIKELAEHLNISRTTLYKRANSYQIDLNGLYTTEQINILQGISINKPFTKVEITDKQAGHSTEQINEQAGHSTEQINGQIEHSTEQINGQIEHKNDQINKEKLLINQLEVKDVQISVLTERLAQAQKALDQSQQLQLIAEQRLTDEHLKVIELTEQQQEKKSFWQKIWS